MHSVLVLQSLRSHWKSISAWSLGMVAIVAMLLAMYPSVQESAAQMDQFIEQFPEALRALFRITDYSSGPGYLSTEMFSAMAPLIFIAVATAWGASATAGEEDKGTADLLFALPISRISVVVSKAIAMIIVLGLIAFVLAMSLFIGKTFIDIELSIANLFAACTSTALLGAVFGSIALLVGAWSGKRAFALGVSVGAAIATYLLYSLAPLVDWLENLLPYNPFEWANGAQPLFNGWDISGLIWLSLTTVAIILGAMAAIQNREFGS
jgi:ABC-2 type transport system permease protein